MAHPPKYTDQQKAAVVHAAAQPGAHLTDVVRKAQAGELGIPAFHVPYKTAHRWTVRAEVEAAREAAQHDALADAHHWSQRLHKAHIARVQDVVRALEAGKCSEHRYRETQKSLAAAGQALKATAPRTQRPTAKEDKTSQETKQAKDLSTLLNVGTGHASGLVEHVDEDAAGELRVGE